MAVKFIISMIFAILVAIFAIQNSSNVEINFLFTKFSISQALVILISAIVGAIIVMILATVTQIKQNIKLKGSTKSITRLEEENRLLTQRVEVLTRGARGKIDAEPVISDAEKENKDEGIQAKSQDM